MYCIVLITCFAIFLPAVGSTAYANPKPKRLELRVGQWTPSSKVQSPGNDSGESSPSSGGLAAAWNFSYWMKDRLALSLSVSGVIADNSVSAGLLGISSDMVMLSTFLVGVRYDLSNRSRVRPYLTAEIGPTFGFGNHNEIGLQTFAGTPVHKQGLGTAISARISTGMDLILGKRYVVGGTAGFTKMTDFSTSVGPRNNYSGFEIGISLGLQLGKR